MVIKGGDNVLQICYSCGNWNRVLSTKIEFILKERLSAETNQQLSKCAAMSCAGFWKDIISTRAITFVSGYYIPH